MQKHLNRTRPLRLSFEDFSRLFTQRNRAIFFELSLPDDAELITMEIRASTRDVILHFRSDNFPALADYHVGEMLNIAYSIWDCPKDMFNALVPALEVFEQSE